MWVGMFREDRLQPTFKRIRRTVTLGPCSNMSRRAPLAALQPYLDAVNVAPAPAPRKVGKAFSDAMQEWREQIAVRSGHSCIASEKRSEEHTSEIQSRLHIGCRLLLEKKTTKH